MFPAAGVDEADLPRAKCLEDSDRGRRRNGDFFPAGHPLRTARFRFPRGISRGSCGSSSRRLCGQHRAYRLAGKPCAKTATVCPMETIKSHVESDNEVINLPSNNSAWLKTRAKRVKRKCKRLINFIKCESSTPMIGSNKTRPGPRNNSKCRKGTKGKLENDKR